MAWPVLTANDVLPGEPSSESASTVGQQLFDRDVQALSKGSTYAFTDTTTASTSYVTKESKQVYIPSFVESGDFLTVYVELWNSGANNTLYQLLDVGSAGVGTEQTYTNGTTHEWHGSVLTLGAWAGTFRTIEIQIKVVAGTGNVGCQDVLANLWFTAQ